MQVELAARAAAGAEAAGASTMPAASERTRLLAPGAASAPPARADSCSPLALTLVLGTCVACGVLVRIPTILQSSIPIWLFRGRGLCPHPSCSAPRAQAWYNPPQDHAARWRQWTKDYCMGGGVCSPNTTAV